MHGCCFCQFTFSDNFEVFRSTLCPECGKEVKVCLNCKFMSPGAHWDCRETIEEPVREKDRANFCSYFKLKDINNKKNDNTISKQEEAKDAFNKLFGG